MASMTLECAHAGAVQAAAEGHGDCPVCPVESKLRELTDQLEGARQELGAKEKEEQTLIEESITGKGPKPKRQKEAHMVSVEAVCRECNWSATSLNGMGLAVQHHDRTEHTVDVETTMKVVYGDPNKTAGSTGDNEKTPEEIFG